MRFVVRLDFSLFAVASQHDSEQSSSVHEWTREADLSTGIMTSKSDLPF